MNYSQTTQKNAQEIQHLSDAFEDLRITLTVLSALDCQGESPRLAHSIYNVIQRACEQIDAIACKVETDFVEKE
jgi:hypothetical protein